MEAYCVKCKAKKEMKDPTPVTMKNGKPATQGTCSTLRHQDVQDRRGTKSKSAKTVSNRDRPRIQRS